MSTVSDLDPHSVRNWQRAVSAQFLVFGAAGMSVLARMPEVAARLDVTTAQLGWLLFAIAAGAITMLQQGGRIVERAGTRPAILTGIAGGALASAAQGVALHAGSPLWFGVTGFLLGCTYGLADVALNVDGTELEKRTQRSLMPRMHAGYSVGALAGAGIGALGAKLDSPILVQLLVLAALQGTVVVLAATHIPSHTGRAHSTAEGGRVERRTWLTFGLVLLGVMLLAITVAEGSANDWLSLSVARIHDATATGSAVVFCAFHAAMTVTRFYGGALTQRWGPLPTVAGLAALGAAGVVILIVSAPSMPWAAVGAALWGLGVALGFPVLLSVAGQGEHGPRRVAFVALCGYGAFVAAPPLLGIVGQHRGMTAVLGIVAGMLALAAVTAWRTASANPH